jgi:hypothetical protein
VRQLGRLRASTCAAFNGVPTLRIGGNLLSDLLLPLDHSACFKRRWMIEFKGRLGFNMFFTLQIKFELNSPVFIMVLVPMRRGFGILTNLSPTQFQIEADMEKSERG